mmetsp:Transcript_29433/g.70740  ORF Transcript_29433/g.70740 Transcript_29433/m.70740 type:complete len:301 (-) Transcript_29433:342-1244(-)
MPCRLNGQLDPPRAINGWVRGLWRVDALGCACDFDPQSDDADLFVVPVQLFPVLTQDSEVAFPTPTDLCPRDELHQVGWNDDVATLVVGSHSVPVHDGHLQHAERLCDVADVERIRLVPLRVVRVHLRRRRMLLVQEVENAKRIAGPEGVHFRKMSGFEHSDIDDAAPFGVWVFLWGRDGFAIHKAVCSGERGCLDDGCSLHAQDDFDLAVFLILAFDRLPLLLLTVNCKSFLNPLVQHTMHYLIHCLRIYDGVTNLLLWLKPVPIKHPDVQLPDCLSVSWDLESESFIPVWTVRLDLGG